MKTQEGRSGESVRFDRDLSSGGALGAGEGVSRRGFMGGMGAMMAAAALGAAGAESAFAEEAEKAEEDAAEEEAGEAADEAVEEAEGTEESASSNYPTIVSTTGWTGTPEDVLALGVSTMPLDDLNQYRQAYLDAQTDYTMEDGTVVPAAYVKMRALVHTYGIGCGDELMDSCFPGLMSLFTEEEAEAYIKLPMGVDFTAYEAAEKEGIEYEEAEELCELFADNGYLCAADTNRGRVYHEIPFFQGSAEYSFNRTLEGYGEYGMDFEDDSGVMSDLTPCMANTGTPTFYVVPVDKSVTSDGTILPFDDLKEKIRHANLVCISPCQCRYSGLLYTYGLDGIPTLEDFHTGEYEDYFSDVCNQRVETCIQTGNEARYWIDMGWGREITGDEAAEFLQRSVDDGFMLQSTFGKDTDTICSCHVDSCGPLSMWAAIGDADEIAACDAFKQVSHYTLEVDPDLCIACGTCVDRCPLRCISINDDGWAEAAANCFRCGQCAYVCPQGARHLVQRDESELAPLPQNMLEDSNVKAAYRFEKQLIEFPEA